MRKTNEQWLGMALKRVITEKGAAANPLPVLSGAGVCKAWQRAKIDGLIRPLSTQEREDLLRTKRSTREVIMAELSLRYSDESIPVNRRYEGEVTIEDLSEALHEACSDITDLKAAATLWTLTEAGVAALGC